MGAAPAEEEDREEAKEPPPLAKIGELDTGGDAVETDEE
jgi:hypothetical protein